MLLTVLRVTAQQTKIENDVKYQAVGLNKDDREFLRLKDTAQKYLPILLDTLKKHGADYVNYRCVVKSDFVDRGIHEHMWSQVVSYSNGMFKAIFVDSPFNVKNVKTGDSIFVNKAAVEDWGIYDKDDKKIAGNFSENYLNSKE